MADDRRKSSLGQFNFPEHLNERLKVVGFPSWIALVVIGLIIASLILWSFFGFIPIISEGRGVVFDPNRILVIRSEIKGTISRISVVSGDHVKKGTQLIQMTNFETENELLEAETKLRSLENFRDQNPELSPSASQALFERILTEKAEIQSLRLRKEKEKIFAPDDGEIVGINISKEGEVQPGEILVEMILPKPKNQIQKIYAVFPTQLGETIEEKMPVQLQLASVDRNKYGLLLGTVTKVFPYLTSFQQGPLVQLPYKELLEYLSSNQKGGVIVEIEPELDPQTFTGYKWSIENGPPFEIKEGTFCNVVIIRGIVKPIYFLFNHRT